jgi:MFS family permease
MKLSPHSSQVAPHRQGVGLWAVAFAFVTVMAFSTVPTPLYAIYQARDGFSTFVITVIFAAYAVGVIGALFFAGHVSDYLGRRRALVPAVLVSLLAAVVFLVWRSLPGLLVGRVLTGLSVGVVTSTATAFVSELHAHQRPGAPPTRAQIVSTSANLGGFCLGPLTAGLLAQYVRSPLTVPFVLFLGLLAAAAIAVALSPETVTRPKDRPAYHPQRIAVPEQARRRFIGAAAGAFVSFAALGLFAALGPSFLAGTLHETSVLLSAVPASAAFAAAVAAQLLATGWPAQRMLATGMAALTVGMLLVVAATWIPSLALFLFGGTIAGAGGGMLFKGGIMTAASLAASDRRAEALAGFFTSGYIGISVPVVGVGILAQFVDPRVALAVFVGLLLLGIALSAQTLLGDRRQAGHDIGSSATPPTEDGASTAMRSHPISVPVAARAPEHAIDAPHRALR